MALSEKHVRDLLRLVGLTRDHEINCEECLARIAEFVERELCGRSVSEALETVEHHLMVCAECHEEYETLRRALQNMEG